MWQSAGNLWKIWCEMICNIRTVTMEDLEAVTEVERACFPATEAAGKDTFAYRISAFPERFFVAEAEGKIVGIVNGCASALPLIEDALFEPQGHEPDGENQMIFGLAVLPEYQRQGIGGMLLEKLIAFAREQGMARVILTCKEQKLAYYGKFGFQNRGVSHSNHGGALWFDMVLELK